MAIMSAPKGTDYMHISYMHILLSHLNFKHRPPPLRPSQYSAASINTPVEIRRRRRKSHTSEKYYQILMDSCTPKLFTSIFKFDTIPRSQTHDDFPPLESHSSVSGPCTRVVSHCHIKNRSGPVRILLFLVPVEVPSYCLFVRNWTDLPQ